ncbi:MAG: hypothetical protein QOE30_1961 [Mycobacterium sp.]|jgi:hypothetical protein|nr:hypothetical protein [Mycobacterium sp.]
MPDLVPAVPGVRATGGWCWKQPAMPVARPVK